VSTVSPQIDYLDAIRAVLPRDGFFVEEISQVGFTARLGFPVHAPRQYVTCGYQDNLGFGFNTALGVKVANPDRAVVSITGDGGFLFGVQELATAVQYGINVVTVVFNNQGFGNVRRDQVERYGGRFLGAELRNPDFVKLAESFGALGLRARTPAELRDALERAFAADVPAVIEVPLNRGSETSPWPFLHPDPPRQD
jgi:acetolactate synthase-1/2/3 large subunit